MQKCQTLNFEEGIVSIDEVDLKEILKNIPNLTFTDVGSNLGNDQSNRSKHEQFYLFVSCH
jgi:hypothetical protein